MTKFVIISHRNEYGIAEVNNGIYTQVVGAFGMYSVCAEFGAFDTLQEAREVLESL